LTDIMATASTQTFKLPPTPVLIVGALGGLVALGGAGAYLYALWQTSLMAGGSVYAVKLPAQKPVDVKSLAQCDPAIERRWLGCSLPPITPAEGEAK